MKATLAAKEPPLNSVFGRPAPDSPIAAWPEDPSAVPGELGVEPPLRAEEEAVHHTMHRFAAEVMRPAGQTLDRLTPEEVIAKDSILWDVFRQFGEIFSLEALEGLEPAREAKIYCIVLEELGWGDGGLAVSLGTSLNPQLQATRFGNAFLSARFPVTMPGCWGITEPDHGSDMIDPSQRTFHPRGTFGRPNCVARIHDDKVVINGQKSAWVSNGTIARACLLFCAADPGSGPSYERGCVIIVPLDVKGVSRGKPLDKIGQRALNQGEIFFDEVELPLHYLLAGPDHFKRAHYGMLSEANAGMSAIWTGAARAAYELALDYAHERKQGGVPIIRHQNVRYRLFQMFRQVEASRALSRRAYEYNLTQPMPALQGAIAAKITATRTAFEVASEALQMFGGNRLTREYPIEKILRDCRTSMIEDGCNEVLAIKGGDLLVDSDRISI